MKKNLDSRKVFLIAFWIVIFTSCKNKPNEEKVDVLKNTIENNLGSKLSIPKKMRLYQPFNNYVADSMQIANANLKIYTRIDASCPTCINSINKWLKFANKLFTDKVPVILVCASKDNFELMKYFCENGEIKKFPYPFFLDKENEYLGKNSFMNVSPQIETVLTDSQDNILLIGNPIHSEDIMKLYLAKVQSR